MARHARQRSNGRRSLRRRPEVVIDGVVVSAGPTSGLARLLEERIIAFNVATTGIDDAMALTGAVRGEDGEVVGGVHGWSWGGTCWVESLWVHEDMRGRGVGSALLRFAEREAQGRGCHQLALDTHSFQAPDFYRRHGFEVVGELNGYPSGHSRLMMRKPLPANGRVADG
jgi:ribosomal protein S18 acetylase RimI-like enzyme